jgi:hypothetical protein
MKNALPFEPEGLSMFVRLKPDEWGRTKAQFAVK